MSNSRDILCFVAAGLELMGDEPELFDWSEAMEDVDVSPEPLDVRMRIIRWEVNYAQNFIEVETSDNQFYEITVRNLRR